MYNYNGSSNRYGNSNFSHDRSPRGHGASGRSRLPLPEITYTPLDDKNYIDEANEVINVLHRYDKEAYGIDKGFRLTTSKIRNLLAMSAEILNKVNAELGKSTPSAQVSSQISKEMGYLRIRTVYECGRDQSVKDFEKLSHLLDCLRDVKTLADAERFCHYMEALVAFHRFMDGRDQ